MIRYIVGTKERGNLFKDNRTYKSKSTALKARSRAYLTVNESLDILEIDIESDKEKILRLEQELQKTREQLEKTCSKLKYATNLLEFANSLMDEDEEDFQEMNEWISGARVFIEQCSKTNKENRE